MRTYRTRAELKNEVKQLLRGNWKQAILLFLIPTLVFWFTGGYSGSNSRVNVHYTTDSFNLGHFVRFASASGIIGFIVSLVFLLITLSASFRALDWLEDPELKFDPIKSDFTYFRGPDWWKLSFIYVIIGIFTFLWSLLLFIPGIIKWLSYSQTYFIYKDANDNGQADNYSLTDYITRSRQLMVGNKWRYFVLQLSFIGWWFLAVITWGIGLIWIYPYYKLTMTNFYRDLVANN